jgi:hypothetical protein
MAGDYCNYGESVSIAEPFRIAQREPVSKRVGFPLS